MTTTGRHHHLVADLRARIDGEVLTDGDPGYDRSRTPHFTARVGRPLAVVRPRHAGDVAVTVVAARDSGTSLAVRGGGHHAACHSTGEGLLLDLGSLTGLQVDTDAGIARAQGGLTAGDVTRQLAAYGLVVGFGDAGTVGVGGLTLGGGIGFLSRLHGMTIDNLLAAEIVTADGRVRTIDAEHEPDLFWAIRGGGGNFGVVTEFTYRLTPLDQVHGGTLLLPATPETIAGLVRVADQADDALTVIASVMALPPVDTMPPELHGQLVLMAKVCHAGAADEAVAAVQPLRDLATPIVDQLGPMPYSSLFDEPAPSAGQHVTVRTMYVDRVDESVGATIIDGLERTDAWLRLVQLRVLGGAIARVPADATAYAHRASRVMVTIARNVDGDVDQARRWTVTLGEQLQQEDRGAYVNFFGPHDGDRIEAAYPGGTLDRLRRIKAVRDPDNVFHNNDNIAASRTPDRAGRQ